MTVLVTISISEGDQTYHSQITIEDSALRDVRFAFNPSGLKNVIELKTLAAALITKANEVGRTGPEGAGRSCASARTNAQQACFWAVHGATEGL